MAPNEEYHGPQFPHKDGKGFLKVGLCNVNVVSI